MKQRAPSLLAALVQELGPVARAGTTVEAANEGDIVVVTIPLESIGSVPAEPLAGKVVIDTNNYSPERDGRIPGLDDESTTFQRRPPSRRCSTRSDSTRSTWVR